MKIRKISLENLNSLVGEHELDLTAEPIASAEIFAITGPTGAGKSTLLDAITLALYGRAARYGEDVPADMMSRHQGRCRAEVEFEVKGGIFRAEWILRRARDKPDGKLQPAKSFVYDQSGTALNQRATDAKKKVEELCGLNYERFLRSVLLAQGEFAKFLKSHPNERAELLESLTGTVVYTELSKWVFEESKRRELVVRDEETLLGALAPMEKEVRMEKETAMAGMIKSRKESAKELAVVATGVLKGEQLAERVVEWDSVRGKLGKLVEERESSVKSLKKLGLHRAAETHFPFLARVEDGLGEVGRVEVLCKSARDAFDAANDGLNAGRVTAARYFDLWAESNLRELSKLEATKKQLQMELGEAEVWLEANESDAVLKEILSDLSAQISALAAEREHWRKAQKKIKELKADEAAGKKLAVAEQEALTKAVASQDEVGKVLDLVTKQLEKLIADGGDEAARRVGLERLEGAIVAQSKLAEVEGNLKKISARLEPERARAAGSKAAFDTSEELLAAHQAHLQTELARSSLEEHRAALEDGEECPLCGSLDHPFSAGGLESGTAIVELKKKIEVARKARDVAKKTAAESAQGVAKLEMQIDADSTSIKVQRNTLDEVLANLNVSGSLLDELEKRQVGLAEMSAVRQKFTAASEAATKLSRQAELAQQAQQAGVVALEKIAAQLGVEEAELAKAREAGKVVTDKLAEALDGLNAEVPAPGGENELLQTLQVRARKFSEMIDGRKKLIDGAKQTEVQLLELTKKLEVLQRRGEELEVADGMEAADWEVDSIEELDARLAALEKEKATAEVALRERQKQLIEVKEGVGERQKLMEESLVGSEFENMEALRQVRLDKEQVVELMALEKRLADRELALKTQLATCVASLEKLRAEKIPEGVALAEMREKKLALDAIADEQRDASAALKAELAADDRCRVQMKEKGAALAEAKEAVRVWQRLNGMIGSADGKRFRRFAQGLSLDVLLRNANSHLQRLSDRYQLGRIEGEELGLEIVDRFQASVTRPMASLSGGESFLTSLALALGLSDLAGRNVQIDSLFIDEGFGSLDGDTLDEAISALEGLRLRDKTVGVISHVELLKERISTQVVVGRDAAGRGTIEVVG